MKRPTVPTGQNWPAQDLAGLVAHGENREWGAELNPWRLGGGAVVNPMNQQREQAGKAALERVRWWVNPFEAKEGRDSLQELLHGDRSLSRR
jgi:hypothetical protein